MVDHGLAGEFGSRLRERRQQVKLETTTLADMLGVSVDELEAWEAGGGAELTLDRLGQLAAVLDTSVGALTPSITDDLDDGIAIQLPKDRQVIPGRRGGVDYYVYNCLVRTRTVPSLVPLVVDVLADQPDEARFNGGHPGSEFLFVLEGSIQMKWGDPEEPREATLPTGASIFIQEGVPHAFTAAAGTGTAKLLAVNF